MSVFDGGHREAVYPRMQSYYLQADGKLHGPYEAEHLPQPGDEVRAIMADYAVDAQSGTALHRDASGELQRLPVFRLVEKGRVRW